MDLETFKAVIEAGGGEDKVIAITFDNGASESFVNPNKPYTHDHYLDEATSCLKFVGMDLRRNYFYVWKPLDTVQAIHFASEYHKRTDYDSQTVRG